MSTDPNSEYLKELGRRVVEQQAAEAAIRPPVIDASLAQANRNHQILARDARRKQDREREAAREKDAQFKAAREKQLAQARAEEADRNLAAMKARARAKWTLPQSDFEAAWRDYLYQEAVLEQQASDEARLQTLPSYRAL